MGEGKRRKPHMRVLPYPTPGSDRCQELMQGVIKGLGKLPTDDDGIEDRVIACLMVAWGEMAAMQSQARRSEILDSLTPLGSRVVARLMQVNELTASEAGDKGETLADMLFQASRKHDA